MTRAPGFAVFVVFALSAGCGAGDPPGIPAGPGAMAASHDASSTGTPDNPGAPGSAGDGGAIADSSIDRDPGYRDPRQADGACVTPNKVCTGADASSACVAIGTDVANCGDCGKRCAGPSATCVASNCTCTDVGFDYCAGGCMDVSADLNNCGRCGNVCDPATFTDCVAGTCVNNN